MPAYAGAYTWGRRAYDPRRKVPGYRGRGRVEREPHECAVFLPDNHPAYITWEQYQSNLQRLRRQRMRGPLPGPARQTVALLAGLVVCGQCGCRMQTRYTRTLRYDCQRHALDYGLPGCQSLVGEPLEQLVAEQILQVVTPAGLELSLRATAECERERAALETAMAAAPGAGRPQTRRVRIGSMTAVEPENRLVARTLERKWEEALLAQRALEEDYARFLQDATAPLDGGRACPDRDVGTQPAGGLAGARRPGWPRSVRSSELLLERVVVWAPASSQEVTVHLHWSLGTVTEHRVRRPVR